MTDAHALPPMAVLGFGFFSTQHASPEDTVRDIRCEAQKPKFGLLVARARRFTSLVTQMHVEVCGQALSSAPKDASPHTIFASHHGELHIAADLISDLLTLKSVSSARFALSVHNAPSGLVSIATGNTHGTTTIAAGDDSFAAGLLEAFLIARERRGLVLLSYADEPIPALFGGPISDVGTGFALLLSPATTAPLQGLGTIALQEHTGEADPRLPFQGTADLAAALAAPRPATVQVGQVRPGHAMRVVFSPT